MNFLKLALALLATLAPNIALAETSATPLIVTEASSSAPAAYDWSGFQLGFSAGRSAGSHDYYDDAALTSFITGYDVSGPLYGAFAGYNMQSGNMVYGVELAYSAANVQIDGGAFPDYAYDRVIDLKGRVGYAMGNVLVYGEIGGSAAHWGGPLEDANISGLLVGAGVDVALGDRAFVGLEYVMRNLQGPETLNAIYLATRQQSVQLRVGINF